MDGNLASDFCLSCASSMATLSTLTFFCEILPKKKKSDISKGANVYLDLQGLNVHEPDCAGIWPDQLFVFFTFWKEFVSGVELH